MDVTISLVERPTPNVQDVFDCAYDVMLGQQFLGTYYKLAGVHEYTPSSLNADTFLSPGPCISYIISYAFQGVQLDLEAEINRQLYMQDACYECSKHTSGECIDCQERTENA